jgi:threonine dehydrogenase-like Zn-dependent dehydrogenase
VKATIYLLEEYLKPLVRKEVEIPALNPGQILVKLSASGVCGSDLHMFKGEDPRLRLPMILGHEGVGIIVGMKGEKRTVDGASLREGDAIIWNRGVSCGACYSCQVLKEPSFCTARIVPGINCSSDESPFLNGCYADYIILPERTDIFKLPEGIDPAVLVAASCSGATAAHGFAQSRPEPGDTVAVIGPGPLGLFAVAFAGAYGAAPIILSGGSEQRLNMGREFGATVVLNRNRLTAGERMERIRGLTSGRGVDLVVEASGSVAGLQEAIGIARTGGTVLSIGMSQPAGVLPLDGYHDLTRRNLRLQGVWVSDTSHVYRAIRMVTENPELFAKLVTHRFPLSRVNEALQVMERKEAVKAVLIPD